MGDDICIDEVCVGESKFRKCNDISKWFIYQSIPSYHFLFRGREYMFIEFNITKMLILTAIFLCKMGKSFSLYWHFILTIGYRIDIVRE